MAETVKESNRHVSNRSINQASEIKMYDDRFQALRVATMKITKFWDKFYHTIQHHISKDCHLQ
jgi:hypothetical protein